MLFLSISKCLCHQMRPFNEVCQQLKILFMCTDFILNFLFYVDVQVIHNVGSVSGVWQSDSVTCIHESVLFAQSCLTLCDYMSSSHQTPRPWDSPGKNTGMGSHSFLDLGYLPNLGLLYCRQILYHLSQGVAKSQIRLSN